MDGEERKQRKSLRWIFLQSSRFINTADDSGRSEERLWSCQTKQEINAKGFPGRGMKSQFEAAGLVNMGLCYVSVVSCILLMGGGGGIQLLVSSGWPSALRNSYLEARETLGVWIHLWYIYASFGNNIWRVGEFENIGEGRDGGWLMWEGVKV